MAGNITLWIIALIWAIGIFGTWFLEIMKKRREERGGTL